MENGGQDDSDWFSILPDELCLKIWHSLSLPDLCKCMCVCQRWNTLCRDDSLWRDIEVRQRQADEEFLLQLSLKHPRIRSLSLFGSAGGTDYTYGQQLQYGVDVWGNFDHLESISLISCSSSLVDTVKGLSSSCPKLKQFRCESSTHFNRQHLLSVLHPSRRYTELSLAHCTQIDDVIVYFVIVLPDTVDCLASLEILNLDGVEFLSDIGVKGVLKRCPALKSISLDGEQLTDKSAVYIGENFPNLEHLSISFCIHLTDKSLEYFGLLKSLKKLHFKKGLNFTNKGLQVLFENLPKGSHKREESGLQNVSLIECRGLVDSGLKTLAENFPNLVYLDLSWCWDLTDKGLESVATHCHGIRTLKLVGLKEARCVPILGASMPRLQYLELVQTDLVDDEHLKLLKNSKPWITILDYYGEEVDDT